MFKSYGAQVIDLCAHIERRRAADERAEAPSPHIQKLMELAQYVVDAAESKKNKKKTGSTLG